MTRLQDQRPTGRAHPDPDLATDSDYSPPRGNPFPIVGIGASAGGLEAFSKLIGALPEKTGFAFVLVQHLDPQHESLLTELMAPSTNMPVITVTDGMQVEPDSVYVIPPNTSMELRGNALRLFAREPGLHLPIDTFFRSLAEVQGSRAIGIVLSGNASDGSLGVRAIKAECGLTFAQDEPSSRFGSMPRNAVATGAIDFVLPPEAIGQELGRLVYHRFLLPATPGVAESEILPEDDGSLRRVFALLQAAYQVDFSLYKPTTIRRRISRRLMILGIETLSDYANYLQKTPAEMAELYKDVLISVTSFFREPDSFESLMRHLKSNINGGKLDRPIRAWVPGCSTGEEVYSLAITLHEFLHGEQLSLNIQVFGTDVSELNLDRARQAIYSGAIAADMSEERLRRFFNKIDGGFQISKKIRESCIFARQDITRDPPFSRIDIVSCRNVLIYLDTKTQKRVLPNFHYALNPNGLLMLGSAETTGAASDLFTLIDQSHHIYARKMATSRLILNLTTPSRESHEPVTKALRPSASGGLGLPATLDQIIQSRYSPDAVVINSEMQIVQFRGHTAPYLDPSPGEASLNLLRMAGEYLVVPLRRALQKSAQTGSVVRDYGAVIEEGGALEDVALEITPIVGAHPSERFFLIVFDRKKDDHAALSSKPGDLPGLENEQTDALHQELAETREYLKHVVEQYEAHAEELRAANEEARSANEELQSTNEELGTTKEELQSANEELTTVNEELQNRNRELAGINSDLRNLLGAVTVGIVMVDQELRIRRFNASAEKLLNLTAVDVGRPVGHLRGRIQIPLLEENIYSVVDTLKPFVNELQDDEGHWYSVAIRPYRTVEDRITGAVITFQDINGLKRGLQASEEARAYAETLVDTVREPLVVLDSDLRVQRATSAFYKTFLVSQSETEGRMLYDLGNGQWNQPRLRELLGNALFRSEPFQDFEVEHDLPHIGRRTMRLNARRIPRHDSEERTVLLAIEDVTRRSVDAELRYQRLFDAAKDGIAVLDVERATVEDINPYLLHLTGYKREEVVGKDISKAGRLFGLSNGRKLLEDTKESPGVARYENIALKTRTGGNLIVEAVANRYTVGSKPVVQVNVRDVTARGQAVAALAVSEQRYRTMVENVRDYAIFQVDETGRILTWNPGAERLLGWKEDEILGQSLTVIFTPEDVAGGVPLEELESARRHGRTDDERWHVRKDGTLFYASGALSSAESGQGLAFTKVMQDITMWKAQQDSLKRSVEEKSALVREIHHRVKNNLQMIVSLLNLQSRHTSDPRVLAAFEDTQSRVRAMAQIHEQLYTSDDLSEVEIGGFMEALVGELIALHSTEAAGVTLKMNTEKVVLNFEKAIPVALIANELILNSLKHGLRSGTGELQVSLNRNGRLGGEDIGIDSVLLRVEDNGPGFPLGFNTGIENTMGFRLINLLVRQLRARLEIIPGPGAKVLVTFPLDPIDR